MTAAGAREASQQFGEWKSSVAEWTSASILGNVLVFAGSSDASAAPRQTVLIADARTSSACKGERSPAAAVQPSRPASQTKAADAVRAKTEKSLSETTPNARDFDALAHSLAAAHDAKLREQFVFKLVPQVSEIAETLGEQLDEHTFVRTAFRVRQTGEAGAGRARAVAELKKQGLRKVYVRIAQAEAGARGGYAFKTLSTPGLPGVFEFTSPAEPRGASLEESAPEAPRGPAVPVDQQDLNCFFKSPGSRR